MLDAQIIRDYVKENLNIDKVGFASIDRFEKAPKFMHPLTVMPNAKMVIVFLKRILRGPYHGIDEGTNYLSYNAYSYLGLNTAIQAEGYKLANYIEKSGYEAMHLPSSATLPEKGPRGPKASPDKPPREISISVRIAAMAAGLGELGYSKVFLSPEFGPRQRIGIVLTDAEIEPDPISVGKICDKCKSCVRGCPADALSKDEKVEMEFFGNNLEWAKLILGRCKMCHNGLNKKSSPFLQKQFPGLYIPIDEQEPSWVEALELGLNGFFKAVPIFNAMNGHYPNTVIAQCGGRGCVFECLKHLEKRGRIKEFVKDSPFSSDKPWRLNERPAHDENNGLVYDAEKEVYLRDRNGAEKTDGKEAPRWY